MNQIMNNSAIQLFRNFSYTISSNIVTLLVSVLVVLILPKIIGIEDYGYWQLFILYSSFVGFLNFGWIDGIYLRYGGKEYKDLDKRNFHSQFILLFISQLIIGILMAVFSFYFLEISKFFIMGMISIVAVIMNIRGMLLLILQATNNIKTSSKIIIIDRVVYLIFIILILLAGTSNYKPMVVADVISRFISLLVAMYFCRDMIFRSMKYLKFEISEIYVNISVGIKLLVSNIAGMLVIGIVRFGIERTWSIVVFGKISLVLSICNLTMIFINAIGIVLFPILRKTNPLKLPSLYLNIRDFLMILMFLILFIHYPLKEIITLWLPEYSDSFVYLSLLLPIIIFEGKMALLINTYLKTLRKEKLLLSINLICLGISFISTIISINVIGDLNFVVLTITILIMTRSIIAEIILSRILKINVIREIIIEIWLTITFISVSWFIETWYSVVLYGLAYLLYIFINRKTFTNSIRNLYFLTKLKSSIT